MDIVTHQKKGQFRSRYCTHSMERDK